MALMWLIAEWVRRLRWVRERLMDAALEESEPDAWLLRVRRRVLEFLVARYSDPERPLRDDGPVDGPSKADGGRVTVCLVEPGHHPPRRCGDLRVLLHEIREINVRKRPRWRWF